MARLQTLSFDQARKLITKVDRPGRPNLNNWQPRGLPEHAVPHGIIRSRCMHRLQVK
jgi:hypothetical protein